jgi:hypothetical protein
MTEQLKRTPALVQQSRINSSTRRVATRRRRTGHSTSRTRMGPWRNRGASWEELKAAEAFLNSFERKRLEQLTDTELFRETLRAITITHRTISRALQKHIPIAKIGTVPDTITVLEKHAVVILQLSKSYKIIVEAWNLLDEATVRAARRPAQV